VRLCCCENRQNCCAVSNGIGDVDDDGDSVEFNTIRFNSINAY
jgi:hypothetical protein